MAIRSSAVKRSRGGQRKVYARADATLLVEHKFHPIEDMMRKRPVRPVVTVVFSYDKKV